MDTFVACLLIMLVSCAAAWTICLSHPGIHLGRPVVVVLPPVSARVVAAGFGFDEGPESRPVRRVR